MVPIVCQVQAVIGNDFAGQVIPLIDKAVGNIRILVFDWRWYPLQPESPVQLFNQAIVRAKRRGVQVQAVVNMVDIVRQLQELGIDCRKVFSKELLHTKLLIVDDTVCVLGSHNYTQSAFGKNFECSVILDGKQAVESFINYFEVIFNYRGPNQAQRRVPITNR